MCMCEVISSNFRVCSPPSHLCAQTHTINAIRNCWSITDIKKSAKVIVCSSTHWNSRVCLPCCWCTFSSGTRCTFQTRHCIWNLQLLTMTLWWGPMELPIVEGSNCTERKKESLDFNFHWSEMFWYCKHFSPLDWSTLSSQTFSLTKIHNFDIYQSKNMWLTAISTSKSDSQPSKGFYFLTPCCFSHLALDFQIVRFHILLCFHIMCLWFLITD